MPRSAKWAGYALTCLLAVMLSSCKSNSPTSNTVTSRTISVRLRAGQIVTYRARILFDGVIAAASVSSTVVGTESVVIVNLDALAVPRGPHVIQAIILAEVPAPSEYRMTASVSENATVVVPEVPDAVAIVGINGAINLAISF